MSNEQTISRRQNKKKPVIAKSASSSTRIKSKPKVKVVNVKLSAKSSKKNLKAKAINKSKQATIQKTTKNKTKKTRAKEKVVTKEIKLSSPETTTIKHNLKAKEVTKTETIPAHFQTPSIAALKSFRAATEKRRKQANQLKMAKSGTGSFLAKLPAKGKKYAIDLRIHSPGTIGYFSTGGVEAGAALVRLAKVKGLDVIGLTDYYNASYVDMIQRSANSSGLTVLPGVDLRCKLGSCNEVYLIALFPEDRTSKDIFKVLNDLAVPPEAYGRKDYCLTLPFEKVVKIVEGQGGILIPSRLDKTPYRQMAISLLVEVYGMHAFDLVHPEVTDYFKDRWPVGEFTFFSFSNANSLAQIGGRMAKVKLTEPGFAGIKELVKRRPTTL